MAKANVGDLNLRNMKRFMEKRHPGQDYKIYEYQKFYTVIRDIKGHITEPLLFDKKGAFPMLKTFNQMPIEDCNNPKLVYESGGEKDGKK